MNVTGVKHIIEIFAFVTFFTLSSCLPRVPHNGNHPVNTTGDASAVNISATPEPPDSKGAHTDRLKDLTLPQGLISHLTNHTEASKHRSKRAIIFRPLFVYRQQEIKKQRLRKERLQAAEEAAASNNYYSRYPPSTQYSDGPRPTRYSDGSQPTSYPYDRRPTYYSDGPRRTLYSDGQQQTRYSDYSRPTWYSYGSRPSQYSYNDRPLMYYSNGSRPSSYSGDPQQTWYSDVRRPTRYLDCHPCSSYEQRYYSSDDRDLYGHAYN
ncbi:uncharacterized protein LOC131693189 [Topomyia yanbarensis]|uniref:uncharacterized protein LOC131693189 n=1 Tax=Topomyia yanbarensis TaxID=2498891 RepID=UPI00273AE433|nr:uncharacterized protein LOC131693189 [Topomyia yanbarensis]